jgi:hypothetical protein
MTRLSAIAVLVFVSSVASTAWADRGACKADIERLCKGVEGGGGRIAKCMKEHEADLSEGCKKAREESHARRKEQRKGMREACHADVEKLCADKRGGKGNMMSCLNENRAKLSPACAEKLPDRK